LAFILDDDGVYPILPRIVTSTLAEEHQAARESRAMNWDTIRVDDERILELDWHQDGRASTPMPGKYLYHHFMGD
jgi:hypothetical protein